MSNYLMSIGNKGTLRRSLRQVQRGGLRATHVFLGTRSLTEIRMLSEKPLKRRLLFHFLKGMVFDV